MNKSILMSSAALLLIMSSPALAQSAPPADGQAATPAPTPAPDGSGLPDIIVTAQKRNESIQSVPVAVTALSAKELNSPTLTDIRDVAGRVPGLVVDNVTAGPSAAAIAIRGISFEDIEKSFDPAVGVSVDGVFIGTNTGQLLDSFDLADFEVLRGPQGTLFGRNTIGGVISVARTKPTGEFGVKASFSYSSFDTKTGKLVVNLPTIGNIIALKAFAFWDDTAGYYHNVSLNRRAGKYATLSGGVTAKITPMSGVEALITYEHQRERGETVSTAYSVTGKDLLCSIGAPANQCDRLSLPDGGQYDVFQNEPTPVISDTDAVTGNLNIDLGGSFSLTSVTGYRRNTEDVTQDFDGTTVPFFLARRVQTFHQFSEELRVVGDVTPWLNVLVGGYYYNSGYKLNQTTSTILVPAFLGGALSQFVDHTSKSYAGFTDVKIKPTENLTIGIGGRYTRDEKSIFNNYSQIIPLVQLSLPNYTNECIQIVGLLAPGVPQYGAANNCSGKASFGKFTWRASVDYKIAPGKLIYASYSTGFRSGGFNGRAASPTSLGPYQPENVRAYEIGLKADWLDRRLRTNFALYQTDYTNKQEEVVQPSPPGSANPQETVVLNAASARIKGFEAEITALPDDHLSFHASFAYTDAKYRSFFKDVNGDNIPDNVSTLTLRRAPKWAWSVGADYDHELGAGKIDISTSFRFIDKYATCIVPNTPVVLGQVINDTRCVTNPRETLDASIGYTTKLGGIETRFTLFGRNLTDNRGISSVLPVSGLFTFSGARPPRSFGGEIQVKF
jgi:iron complex outermembrane receptor protein